MPVELTRAQLDKLAWSDHVTIWKAHLLPAFGTKLAALQDHVDQLAAELERTKQTGEEVTDRLLDLIQECSTLSLSLCVINPLAMLRFQTTRLDQPVQPNTSGGPLLPPNPTPSPHSHWQYIEAAIDLDDAQRQHCHECRRIFLTQLGQILRQRAELHELAIRTCRAVCVDRPESGGVAEESQDLLEAMETLQKLQRNLREEQKLIVQRMIVNHQCSLRPRQAALKVVLSWPWYPDTLAIIEASAARAGTEPSTSSLLGLNNTKLQ